MSQPEVAKEQQRLDSIMNRRAMGLYSSTGGTRTRAATTPTTAPKWATPVTTALTAPAPTAPRAPVTAANIGTGACALGSASTTSPPPVPPRSPVMAPPPVPPRSPLLVPTTSQSAESVAIEDSELQCDDQEYRAKCEKQRLDKYISGEWRVARLLKADSGVTKTKKSKTVSEADQARERDHKEMCDVGTKRRVSVETDLTLVSLFIDELVYLLRKTATPTATAGCYDNEQALVIVKKAKEVKDAVVNLTTFMPSSSATVRVADDVNALAGAIARLVHGWREGTAVDSEAAGGVANQALQLQQQLRQLALAQ